MKDKPRPCSEKPSTVTQGEFAIIDQFFSQAHTGLSHSWPSQGIGDDCAFLDVGASRLAVTADMMAVGSHFLEDADPEGIGHKALAVNLSDLAAAGAVPKAFFLSIALPRRDDAWLGAFSKGLFSLAERFDCPLRGGDTTKCPTINGSAGALTIAITALGELPSGAGLTRSGAKTGDDVWVSGFCGEAFAALGTLWGQLHALPEDMPLFCQRLNWPEPRVKLGQSLLSIASAACDVSDGLLGDLGHILERSGVGAVLEWERMPRSRALRHLTESEQERCVLAGGDDYELVFTAPAMLREEVYAAGQMSATQVTRIGTITAPGTSLVVLDAQGRPKNLPKSFNHFL